MPIPPDFDRANRLEIARAVRDGRLTKEEAGAFLLERSMIRLRRLEAKERRLRREAEASNK